MWYTSVAWCALLDDYLRRESEERQALNAWNASPRRPPWMQCAGDILGPSRCLEFKNRISGGWKWRDANELRLKEWLADFTWGRRQAFSRGDDRPMPASEFDQACTLSEINRLLGRGDVYCTDPVIEPDESEPQLGVASPPDTPRKRGRKGHDWKSAEQAACRLMDYHGDFTPDDKEWDCQERLLEKLHDESGISRSSLAERVPAMVDRWRVRKSEN